MTVLVDIEDAVQRCKSTWTTLGIVSALLAAISTTPILSAAQGSTAGGNAWTTAAGEALLYILVLAFMLNIAVIFTSVILYIFINHCLTEEDVKDFIRGFSWVFGYLGALFMASCVAAISQVIVAIQLTTLKRDFAILTAIVGAIMVPIWVLLAWIWLTWRCGNAHVRRTQRALLEKAKATRGTARLPPPSPPDGSWHSPPEAEEAHWLHRSFGLV
jgi:hypothetical protein